MRSLHSLRSCVPLVASEQSSSAVEMTYCVVPFRQNQSPFRHFVANHLPCRNKQTKKLVNPLGLAQNPRIFASVLIHIAFGFSYLVSDFLFHIELICLLERERGLQGCKPRSFAIYLGASPLYDYTKTCHLDSFCVRALLVVSASKCRYLSFW